MSWKITISGEGIMPAIVTERDVPLSTTAPPHPPPPPPDDDPSGLPFIFPADCPRRSYDADAGDRAYEILDIGGDNGKFYATGLEDGNPSERSHTCAGIIQAGRYTGDRLWVPIRAGVSHPDTIRRILAMGS